MHLCQLGRTQIGKTNKDHAWLIQYDGGDDLNKWLEQILQDYKKQQHGSMLTVTAAAEPMGSNKTN